MELKVLLPTRVFLALTDVSRIIVETSEGSMGILPHRLDGVAAVRPGILVYAQASGEDKYVAVDEGVLIKVGASVIVSVRNAFGGIDLRQMRETVKREFCEADERELNMRSAMAKMESGFIRRVAEFYHE